MSSPETEPYGLSPFEYKTYVEEINGRYLSQTRQNLLPLDSFLQENNICAIVVGSDGKGERHAQSKTEIVYIQGQSLGGEISSKKISDLYEELTGRKYSDVFETDVGYLPEKTNLGIDILSFVSGDNRRIFPDRVLNSKLVGGASEVHQKARISVLGEIGRPDNLAGLIRRELKRQKKEANKTCQTGVSRKKLCFNQSGQFYDESENPGSFGFKHGFIRFIQRDLDLRTQSLIIDRVWSPEKAAELPTSTVGRISFFDYNKDTAEAYLWFLEQYHEVQERYKNRKRLSVVPFDDYNFRQCSEIILRNDKKL
jgi:hypothetical protein